MFLLEVNRMIDPITNWIGQWASEINVWSILLRMVMAVIFAGIVGVERAVKRKAAGFRTHILVCVGSTIAILTNQFIFETFQTGDVSRIASQVVSGIGFLGAGTILITSRNQVKGLTTAAGLWASACMGIAIGIGFYTLAIVSFFVIMLSLELFPFIQNEFREHNKVLEIQIEFDSSESVKLFIDYIRSIGLKLYLLERNQAFVNTGIFAYSITMAFEKREDKKYPSHNETLSKFKALEYVTYIEEVK